MVGGPHLWIRWGEQVSIGQLSTPWLDYNQLLRDCLLWHLIPPSLLHLGSPFGSSALVLASDAHRLS
jgi:hypothetical protein